MNKEDQFTFMDDMMVLPDIDHEEWIAEEEEEAANDDTISLPEFYELQSSPITMHHLHYISNKKNPLKALPNDTMNIEACPEKNTNKKEDQDVVEVVFQDWICLDQYLYDEPIEDVENKKVKRPYRKLSNALLEQDMNLTNERCIKKRKH